MLPECPPLDQQSPHPPTRTAFRSNACGTLVNRQQQKLSYSSQTKQGVELRSFPCVLFADCLDLFTHFWGICFMRTKRRHIERAGHAEYRRDADSLVRGWAIGG